MVEAVIEHLLEPEVALPAPRRAHLPLRSSALLGVAVLLLGVFMLGSERALWEGVKLAWLAGQGKTTVARITAVRSEPSVQKGQEPRPSAICYAGTVPGPNGPLVQSGWISLSEPASLPNTEAVPIKTVPAASFRIGQPIPLRYAHFLGATFSQPWGPNAGSRILTFFLTGGLVLAVSLLLLRRLLHWRQGRLYLLRQGTATIGTITHTRSESEDMVRYFLRYGYSVGADEGRQHEEQVSADQWRQFHVGQPVTVLYDPQQPERAGLYALIVKH